MELQLFEKRGMLVRPSQDGLVEIVREEPCHQGRELTVFPAELDLCRRRVLVVVERRALAEQLPRARYRLQKEPV